MSDGDSQHSECCICLQPEVNIKSTRSNKDNCICCDCCHKWFHASCGGLTQSNYAKIRKDNLWLKCVVCCVQQLLLSVSGDSPLLVDSVISVAESRVAHSSCRKVTGKVKKRNTTKGSKSIDSEVVLNSDNTQCSDVGRCCVDLIILMKLLLTILRLRFKVRILLLVIRVQDQESV